MLISRSLLDCVINVFFRLVQYSLPGIAFSSEEANDTWCGWPSRNCADCRASPVGYSTDLKCADRMMTERLRSHLAALQRIVSAEFPGRKLQPIYFTLMLQIICV